MPTQRFLIDVNLPKYFSFFNSDEFEFVIDINGRWPDRDIWEYAKENRLVIVTKDADFHDRCLLDSNPPQVIYLRLGNLLLRELHQFFAENWASILAQLPEARLLVVTRYRVEIMRSN